MGETHDSLLHMFIVTPVSLPLWLPTLISFNLANSFLNTRPNPFLSFLEAPGLRDQHLSKRDGVYSGDIWRPSPCPDT